MKILRFPNPGSDISKFIITFATIYKELEGKENFTHDDTRDAVIKHGLASSSGAIGEEAIRRSMRADRSRDPLYNQLKMYSELYRMLGWLQPGTQRTNFKFTHLSYYIATSQSPIQFRLFEECLLSIVFPNPLVESRSGTIIRPFPLLLKLSQLLGDIIFRDEMIVFVYPLETDRAPDTVQKIAAQIESLRGDTNRLFSAKKRVSQKTGILEETLENYTRFPLGSLKGVGWADARIIRGIYEKPLRGYCLKERGKERASQLNKLIDVRNEDIEEFSLEERGAFTLMTYYLFLNKCGFDISENAINSLKDSTKRIFDKLKVSFPEEIFYSPIQQSTVEEIEFASDLDKNYAS